MVLTLLCSSCKEYLVQFLLLACCKSIRRHSAAWNILWSSITSKHKGYNPYALLWQWPLGSSDSSQTTDGDALKAQYQKDRGILCLCIQVDTSSGLALPSLQLWLWLRECGEKVAVLSGGLLSRGFVCFALALSMQDMYLSLPLICHYYCICFAEILYCKIGINKV